MQRYVPRGTLIDRVIRFCLDHTLLTILGAVFLILAGIYVVPFDWQMPWFPRQPLNVDAIPDTGENQQIVFTEWPGRSPHDVEQQITYPLTCALMGVPRVKSIRSLSMFGASSIYVIFHDDANFYDCRARLVEKLASLPETLLPAGVRPTLGPDATALGQVFWYTLEGRDEHGQPAGGWSLEQLRSIQDWYVRFALLAAEGVSEVASIGGFVKEYHVDVDPAAMRAAGVGLDEVARAVRDANKDVSAGVLDINRVQYLLRSRGLVARVEDIANAVITVRNNVPVLVRHVAQVSTGPALRTGVMDKEGTEVVGGVVVARHGANPLETITHVKRAIAELQPSLPRVSLQDGRTSQVTIVPFYDRTRLIYETLGTLNRALYEQILVTAIVVLLMMHELGTAVLIAVTMPLAVLCAFLAMKVVRVDANIMSLSGIAIAIGTLVDMGVIMCENIQRHLQAAAPDEPRREVVYRAATEVGSAVVTAITTTVLGFVPVFALEGPEGKLFRPLAFTKTFALTGSVLVALTLLPVAAYLFSAYARRRGTQRLVGSVLIISAILAGVARFWWGACVAGLVGAWQFSQPWLSERVRDAVARAVNYAVALLVIVALCVHWLPLGADKGIVRNAVVGGGLIVVLTMLYMVRQNVYRPILAWCLTHKRLFLLVPGIIMLWGWMSWRGAARTLGWLPEPVRSWRPFVALAHAFPGLGREFMPPLDEGAFLFMPTTMAHASLQETTEILHTQNAAIRAIPEVESVVGKVGRAETALDPAPITMIETLINYRPEYLVDQHGRRLTFAYDPHTNDIVRDEHGNPLLAPDGLPYTVRGCYLRDGQNRLIPARYGRPFRLWRPPLDPALNPGRVAWHGIRSPDDIWDAIIAAATIPGVTAAPKLQPIAARMVMLQTGVRASMAVKITGPSLEAIEHAGITLEQHLRAVPALDPATVVADRMVAQPYLEIHADRAAMARYGLRVNDLQDVIEMALGGMPLTTTLEGRERYTIRVRYARELRDTIEALGRIIVPTPTGAQIPLQQVATISYVRGPSMIRSENSFLTGYVVFDKRPGVAEVDAVEQAREYLRAQERAGSLQLPTGVMYTFTGNYENNVRATRRLAIIIPVTLAVIFLALYLQFKSVSTTLLVYSGVPFIAAGGFILLWLYAQPWFLNFSLYGLNLRELFHVGTTNLNVAVWVGFIALFGLATDDGVVIATYLDELFAHHKVHSIAQVRALVIAGGCRRVRACMMTTATTVLALLPVLTSTGRGADVMIPMTIPLFGGMVVEALTSLIVPVLFSATHERRVRRARVRN